ncbi:hypothetical protein I3842_15G025400 [Carya illinoinensis]|uniref:Uncharacterized protein n=1 Tax=Carya illinoinensis TaxID=32201 RepID=A0A922AAJ7_CARIL|nr:hypothetical protein I3842_15G025400 [Carya illinoinensis]
MLDPATKLLQNGTRSSDHIGHVSDSSGNSYQARNYGSRARKAAQNYTKYNSWNGTEVRFAPEVKAVDDSDICSPPLWTTSPPESPQHRENHYRSLSPKSRTEAIARGQQELMEMVRNMPESCYELTLKDLVEQPLVEPPRESVSEERDPSTEILYRRESSKKMSGKRALVRRSTSGIDGGGLYLKMGFPIFLGSRKNNKKNEPVTNTNAKVPPKPPVPDGSAKVVDKEWWKKRFSVSGESESGGSISNSGSMKSSGSSSSSSRSSIDRSRSRSRSSSRHGSGSCWCFIRTKKKHISE